MVKTVRVIHAQAMAEKLFSQRLKDVEVQVGVWMQRVRELEKKLEKTEPVEIIEPPVTKVKLKPKKV